MAEDEGTYQFTLAGLRAPPRFQGAEEAKAFLECVTTADTIANATYFGVSLPKPNINEQYVLTTYPREWEQHYFARRYFGVDPAISVGMNGILPYDWHSVPSGRSKRFFNEARDFGLGWNGLSIPIRGAHGERALFSVNSPLLDGDWADFKQQHQAELTIFAYLFHLRVLELEGISNASPSLYVRPRECEVLQWAARGKSSWETSQILGLSEATVNFYIRNVALRLGASTKTQAVAVALSSHLI